jgi:selenophosphate synthetase-related protein
VPAVKEQLGQLVLLVQQEQKAHKEYPVSLDLKVHKVIRAIRAQLVQLVQLVQ